MFKKTLTSVLLTSSLLVGAVAVPTLVAPQKAEAAFSAPMYKQTDSRWASDLMGGGGTIGDYGCVISSIAMGLAHKNITIGGNTATPKNFNSWLKSHNGYSGNAIIWGSVENLNSRIHFIGRYSGHTSVSAATLKSDLDAGNHIVLANVHNGAHWVILKNYSSNTFNVNDPAYSTTTYNYSDMVGYAIYKITN